MTNEQEYQSQVFVSENAQIDNYKKIQSISFKPIKKRNDIRQIKKKGEIRWFKLLWLIPIFRYKVSTNYYRFEDAAYTYSEYELLSDHDIFIKDGEIYNKAVVGIQSNSHLKCKYFDTNEAAKAFMDEQIKLCKKYGNNLV